MTLPPEIARLPEHLLPVAHTVDEPGMAAGSHMRWSAVLVLLFPGPTGARFVLTERPGTLSRHPGQISLPGGRAEGSDRDLWHTAVRESQEEIGLRSGRMVPLGRLAPVHLTVSGYLIVPFVGWNPIPPSLRPHPLEVAALIEVEAAALLDRSSIDEEVWELRGSPWVVTFFRFGTHVVWGATARVLADLAERMGGEGLWGEWPPGSVRPATDL